jgi:hypothetical protein
VKQKRKGYKINYKLFGRKSIETNILDLVVDGDSISFEERILNVKRWITEIKKTLRGCGIYKNEKKLLLLERQRYPLRKGENEQDVSKYMMMNATLLFFEPSTSAISFIDWSNVLEFSSKHIRNSGDNKLIVNENLTDSAMKILNSWN